MIRKTGKIALMTLILLTVARGGRAQILSKNGFRMGGIPGSGPQGNVINDIHVQGTHVWVGSEGLSLTSDNGESWTRFNRGHGLGKGSVSAIASRGGTVWVATAFDTTTELGNYDAGGGLAYSTDGGETWTWLPQPVDDPDETEYKPTTTVIQNLTYDIALTDSTVWITSFGGGLRKSSDGGDTWRVITVDGLPFDALGYLTHRAFSVIYDGEAVWVGTAGGVHRSMDGGVSWTTFSHQNQDQGVSGNFVVAMGHQKTPAGSVIWAATVEALGETEYRAVSRTWDNGLTWEITLEGEFAHNFAFDSLTQAVYVTTDNGLYKSPDYGETWAVFPTIQDAGTGEMVYTTEVYSVGVVPGLSLWVGTADGLAMSRDDGLSWTLFRAFPVPGTGETPATYAYPNPFSPFRHNQIGGEGYVRFQYHVSRPGRVTVRVYDFAMKLVRTVSRDRARSFPGDYAEAWDGRNDVGEMVANGVYFYRIEIEGENPLWGKVMVVN